jgi:hypothetical protein
MEKPLAVLYRKDCLAQDVVEIGTENPWNLQQGDFVRIVNGSFTQIANVVLVFGVSVEHADHVSSSKWTDESGTHGSLEKLSPTHFRYLSFQQSPRLKIGLLCAVLTIVFAYLTACTKDGSFNPNLGGLSWAFFIITIAATLGGWSKDLWN